MNSHPSFRLVASLAAILVALTSNLCPYPVQAEEPSGPLNEDVEDIAKIGVPEQTPSTKEKSNGESRFPRVLLLGDSISGGYVGPVGSLLKGKALVQRGNNGGPTTAGLKNLDQTLGVEPWDLIHFNWGLHDMTFQSRMAPEERGIEQYAARLEELVVRLKKTGAQLIWATTTPWCPEPYAYAEKRLKIKLLYSPEDEKRWKDAALAIMEKYDVPVNDLHALLLPNLNEYLGKPDDIHFNREGSEAMARKIAVVTGECLQLDLAQGTVAQGTGHKQPQQRPTFGTDAGAIHSTQPAPLPDWPLRTLHTPATVAGEARMFFRAQADDIPVRIQQARASALIAGYSLGKVKRWLNEVALPKINSNNLYVSHNGGSARYSSWWNYDDTAADTYPFLFWAAWYTDIDKVNGPVKDVLIAEQLHGNLNNHAALPYGRVPTAVNPTTLVKEIKSAAHTLFAASEYVKDGLIAIVEVAGKDNPWFTRMQGIIDDIWANASINTPYGRVPTSGTEVDGDQLQALVRLFTMTGDAKYLDWAERLADNYLLETPGRFVPTALRDHGSEIIGGLGLLFAVESVHRPAKAAIYRPHIQYMLDQILARGTNADGLMFNTLDQGSGKLSDSWGYNYVAYLCHDMVVQQPRYTPGLRQTLRNLSKPLYKDYPWEGAAIDGWADSIEGAFYQLNRIPVPEGLAWADREMSRHVTLTQNPDVKTTSLWGTYKLESNAVRTVIQHAMMHTRGLIARPWHLDLQLGAAQTADGVVVSMTAGSPYSGILVVDKPRHRLNMGFTRDWPRMNTMPEWFTAEPGKNYFVENPVTGTTQSFSGAELHAGLPVTLQPGVETLLVIRPE